LTSATYLYCVLRARGKPSTGRLPAGVPGGERPRILDVGGGLWLVATDVPADRYAGEALDAALRDLDWVAKIAVGHEAVVEHFARQPDVTVVPMKLFTMFSSDERALAEMRRRRKDIAAAVRRIAGAQEWGVRIMRGSALAPARQASAERGGVAFLAARKRARDASREAALAAVEAADTAFARLSAVARAVRRRDREREGTPPPLLDAAFLVPATRRAAFQAAAREQARACRDAGAVMTLTGPWPAYNFVSPATERT
jgi:hypothetical protein